MRLEFNIVLVDDDLHDEDNNSSLLELERRLNEKISEKGFNPVIKKFSDADSAASMASNRIDLYISDNNLGDNGRKENEVDALNSGIDLYFVLSQSFICDFILYTRSDNGEIVRALSSRLLSEQNPNLFTRFTFVSRNGGRDFWFEKIMDVIDHLLTKREELNTLRAIYAHQASKIDAHLKQILRRSPSERFYQTIDSIPDSRFKDGFGKDDLHRIRHVRNGLVHNDEQLCEIKNMFYVTHKEIDDKNIRLYEDANLQPYRSHLQRVLAEVLSWE